MPRRENNRIVQIPPLFTEFKPVGIGGNSQKHQTFSLDEYEAIKLADFIGLNHEEASWEMGISRSTFSRLIVRARRKLAKFIVQGKAISIEGGNVHFKNNMIRCESCGYMFIIKIEKDVSECPKCHSEHLVGLAGGFGHGNCCIDHKQNRIKDMDTGQE